MHPQLQVAARRPAPHEPSVYGQELKKIRASTAGWGFAQFNDGKPADEAVHQTYFACHQPVKTRDFVSLATHSSLATHLSAENRNLYVYLYDC